MKTSDIKEKQFLQTIKDYEGVLKRVCFMYSSPSAPFEDLYQEVLANLWNGIDSFRGEAKISTWIYRTAINTCVTWHRRNSRHHGGVPIDAMIEAICDENDIETRQNLADIYMLISRLNPLEKAIIMMWLDQKSYEEISFVTGLTHRAVATRIHRIKIKLKDDAG